MKNLQRKIAAAIAGSALVMQMVPAVALASVSCTISGNGSDTDNNCNFASLQEVTVEQDNNLDVDNQVDVESNTGGNTAEDNTGGNVEVTTGKASVDVAVDTNGNTNAANVANTNSNGDYDLTVSGNGTNSDNNVDLDVTDKVTVKQDNKADVDNKVDVEASTGKNEANDNTGGNVVIDTGDVVVESVKVSNALNVNSATVGDDRDSGVLSAWISDNGSDTDNKIDLALLSEVEVDQENDADVENDVWVDGVTGKNEGEDNTGGDSEVTTGDVTVDVTVDTMANFNQADVSGTSMGEVELKIKENGTDSDNTLDLDLTDALDVDQDNDFDADSDVDVEGKTGDNELEDNTLGEGGDDPSIDTGASDTSVSVSTSGNANVFGGDMDLQLDFDMSELVNLLNALGALLGL